MILRLEEDGAEGTVAQVNWALDNAAHITQAIAALPDLLIALQAILAEIDGPDRPYSTDSYLPEHIAEQARAAMRKAGGPL